MPDDLLRHALTSPDARVTLAAALALTRLPHEQLSPALAALAHELSSGTLATRRRAAWPGPYVVNVCRLCRCRRPHLRSGSRSSRVQPSPAGPATRGLRGRAHVAAAPVA